MQSDLSTGQSPSPAPAAAAPVNATGGGTGHSGIDRHLIALAAGTVVLLLSFALPLFRWIQFGLGSELYSYTLLVPFISGYLAWTLKRNRLEFKSSPVIAAGCALAGASLLALWWHLKGANPALAAGTSVALTTSAFVLFFWALAAGFLGTAACRAMAFPLVFLIFMAPLPASWEHAFESFLQHASADASYVLIRAAGTPILREDTVFMLPGITFQVAPECSGIRSTIVLFLTSLVAGHLFLQRTSHRAILAVSVIVLGVLRNAFRIFTLGELCVHVDPAFIDSPLHHRGGPIFFVLSLIPLFLLLWFLRKRERVTSSA